MSPPTRRSSHQEVARTSASQAAEQFQSSSRSWSSQIIALGTVESSQRTGGSDHDSRYRRAYSSKSAASKPGGRRGSRRPRMNVRSAGGVASA